MKLSHILPTISIALGLASTSLASTTAGKVEGTLRLTINTTNSSFTGDGFTALETDPSLLDILAGSNFGDHGCQHIKHPKPIFFSETEEEDPNVQMDQSASSRALNFIAPLATAQVTK